jgi:L-ascorbate metabolism protein UlaG (beta-lactamase superfamily)
VPIGDRFTMNPASAAFAVKRFFKHLDAVVPCHYGSFPVIEPNADRFVAEMKGGRTKVVVPEKGKAFSA